MTWPRATGRGWADPRGTEVSRKSPLWAPWRMEYVGDHRDRDCIFCLPEGSDSDRKRQVLYRGARAFVLLNRFPYAPGHLMVAPFRHTGKLHELGCEDREESMELIAQSSRILEEAYRCEGLNVGANLGEAAGAGFAEHLHFHLVPRWSGDINFMTTLADTRVIPQHLEQSYAELAPRFAALPGP